MPGPTGRSVAYRRRYEERQRFVQSPEFTQIATAMTTRWPHLFRVTPETIRPLAIGIYHDLCAHLPEFPPKLVHHTLSQWMADHRVLYWKAVMQGGPRYDLEGNPKGEVTPEQQASARQQRKAWYDRREARRKQCEGTAPEAAPSDEQAGIE
ncbi:MAG: ProQ/FinO family protein [Deltaproteobacteria bacterium]|nr:ProQ/FinO family protein [Deltaproteobacteria bacterium]